MYLSKAPGAIYRPRGELRRFQVECGTKVLHKYCRATFVCPEDRLCTHEQSVTAWHKELYPSELQRQILIRVLKYLDKAIVIQQCLLEANTSFVFCIKGCGCIP